jgi:D-amino-acid dehydrogenase
MYDAIVIGGGIVGASAAYHLVRGGATTLLIDRADPGRASDAGAGIVTAGMSGLGIGDSWFDFAVEAEAYYPLLVEQLRAAQAGDTGYAVCGLLRVAMDDDEVAAFEQMKQSAMRRYQRSGIPHPDDMRDISATETRKIFPPLGDVQRALYYGKAARMDGRLFSSALIRAARQQGLHVEQKSIEKLTLDGHEINGVVADGETISAGGVIIAGGAWSRAFGEQLGVEIPLEPLRGQIIHLGLPGVDTTQWPIIEPFRSHYMVCWPDSRVVAGATREHAGFQPHMTAGGVHEVLSEALRVAPGLASAEIREFRVGLRPHTADHLPVLGTVPGVEGVYLATGMGATGLHLGPYSGKLAAEWALGQESATDIAAFSVGRFLC